MCVCVCVDTRRKQVAETTLHFQPFVCVMCVCVLCLCVCLCCWKKEGKSVCLYLCVCLCV